MAFMTKEGLRGKKQGLDKYRIDEWLKQIASSIDTTKTAGKGYLNTLMNMGKLIPGVGQYVAGADVLRKAFTPAQKFEAPAAPDVSYGDATIADAESQIKTINKLLQQQKQWDTLLSLAEFGFSTDKFKGWAKGIGEDVTKKAGGIAKKGMIDTLKATGIAPVMPKTPVRPIPSKLMGSQLPTNLERLGRSGNLPSYLQELLMGNATLENEDFLSQGSSYAKGFK